MASPWFNLQFFPQNTFPYNSFYLSWGVLQSLPSGDFQGEAWAASNLRAKANITPIQTNDGVYYSENHTARIAQAKSTLNITAIMAEH